MDSEVIKQKINDWYHAYSNDIYKYVFFLVGDYDAAKDILQDTFLRVYQNIGSYQGGNVKNWLFRIARNLAIDYIRKRKPIAYFFDSIPTLKAKDKVPEQIALLNETEQQLYLALSKVRRSYRDVIVLRKLKELSIRESAQVLGWSENKVKVTLFRGMSALKRELEKEGYSHETI